MPTIAEAIAAALEHQQEGRLQPAEQIYRQILAVDPRQVDALHLLGVVACQAGNHAAGIELMKRAIELFGTDPAMHNNLGNAYKEMQKPEDAAICCRHAMELDPNFGPAYYNLGDLRRAQGRFEEAEQLYRRALELGSNDVETNLNLGIVLRNQGKWAEAVDTFHTVLETKPNYAEAHYSLSIALAEQGKMAEAVESYRRVLEINPAHVESHINLGNILKYQGNLDQAIALYRRAIELNPLVTDGHYNLGNSLSEQGKLDEAVAAYRKAIEINPSYVLAHYNLGLVLYDLCKFDDAIHHFERSLQIDPKYTQARLNLAYARLLAGDFEKGWPALEYRWEAHEKPRRFPEHRLWAGESLQGKTILLHAEQGLGDTIQFIRFAPILQQQGATVVVECRKRLLPLLKRCPGIDQLIGRETPLPAFDFHAPFMSVPGILKTTVDTVPNNVPYVFPEPALVDYWREQLKAIDGFKIGITWQGNPNFRFDHFRSIPLNQFARLASVSDVRLISLQKRTGTDQLADRKDSFPIVVLSEQMDEQAGVFMDTAAVMTNLDLVITSDTATAHLAGSLGLPVWVALAFAPDWRWMLGRSDSPWYPSMRLFRQTKPGDWDGVFEEIQQALCDRKS